MNNSSQQSSTSMNKDIKTKIEFASLLISFFSLFILSAGLWIGWSELKDRRMELKANATLQLVNSWQVDGARDAFLRLQDSFLVEMDKTSPSDKVAAENDIYARLNLHAALTDRILDNPNSADDYESVVFFFQRLSICIQTELCLELASEEFFGATIESFSAVFWSKIEKDIATRSGFGNWYLRPVGLSSS